MNISDLVKKYKTDQIAFLKPTYNETQLRNDFINNLLHCFGWDVDNKSGKSFFLRDVIQEESIEVTGEYSKKKPDYTLRVDGTRKIFVEAKKPSVDIIRSAKASFQIRRYGWSANLGISILTNFEHLIIYDCRTKPMVSDNECVGRYKIFSCDDYEKCYDEISKLISYDAVASGMLEDFFSLNIQEKHTFDSYFLKQIEDWREKIARSAISRNDNLNEEEVNYVTQRLLNRIIFLRICEDRAIEKYETLKGIRSYAELKQLFHSSDAKFNSGLFGFIQDTLSLNIIIDSGILIEIFNDLYFPQSPYDFSVVDTSILSQIYERFLGRRVTVDNNRHFNIVDTPEVAASNGVVPTPKNITEQIVKDTILPLVLNKTFREISELKVADICCGSGTFLITAYDFLLEKLTEAAIREDICDPDIIYENSREIRSITFKSKKSIVENMLYGVDINPYAVEVAIFNLLLKLLENENDSTLTNYSQKYNEKILPDLKSNIKCGNSLVDNKFFEFMPTALVSDEILFDIRVFNWDVEFPFLEKNAGFDAIIGNPPYVRIQNMKKYSSSEVKYYQAKHSHYIVAKKATIDKYFVFIQKGLELLKPSGMLGYIVPHKFFINTGGKELRKFITQHYQISKIIHFGVSQVFPGRSTYTSIIILQVQKKIKFEFMRANSLPSEALSSHSKIHFYESNKFNQNPWVFLSPDTERVFDKLKGKKFEKLGRLTDITVGLQTSADNIFVFKPIAETKDTFFFIVNKCEYEIEKDICRPAIYKLSFDVFDTIDSNAQMIFPYEIKDGKAFLFEQNILEDKFPFAWKYLNEHKDQLARRKLQGNNPIWYQYGRSQSLTKFHDNEKLIWSVLAVGPPYILDSNNILFTGGGNGPYYGLINKSEYSLHYFLGILSHPLIEQMVKASASEFRGAYYSHGKQFIQNLPIRKIDFTNHTEITIYNTIVQTVKNMISTAENTKNERISSRKKILVNKQSMLYEQLISSINILYDISSNEYSMVIHDEMLIEAAGVDK